MNPMPVRMFEACSHSEYTVLQDLIEQGHDVNHVWPGSLTLLHVAASRGDARAVEILLEAGARVDATTVEGKTALFMAAEKGFRRVIVLMHRYKADLDLSTNRGDTPLHAAMSNRHFDSACQLLWMGSNGVQRNLHGLRAEDMAPLTEQTPALIDLFRAARLRQRRVKT